MRGTFAAVILLSALSARADEPVVYSGPHPPHPAVRGRFCGISGEHAHDYAPGAAGEYLRTRGVWVFLGDPTAYGWEGPSWMWPGPHPLPVSLGFEGMSCARRGMHRHHFGPEAPAVVVHDPACRCAVHAHGFFPVDVAPRPRGKRPPHAFDTAPRPWPDARTANPPAAGPSPRGLPAPRQGARRAR